jgi:hypothetical protein
LFSIRRYHPFGILAQVYPFGILAQVYPFGILAQGLPPLSLLIAASPGSLSKPTSVVAISFWFNNAEARKTQRAQPKGCS